MKKIISIGIVAAFVVLPELQAKSMYKQFYKVKTDIELLKEEVQALKESNTALEKELIRAQEERESVEKKLENLPSQNQSSVDNAIVKDLQNQISDLNSKVNGNHLKFGADFRTSVDNLQYTMADGTQESNDAFLSNRLWLHMGYKVNERLSFSTQLAFNKAYGARSGSADAHNESFDWIATENPNDATLRVRSAYFLYMDDTFLGANIPWTFSLGRRPSTNGQLVNLRDDIKASNPLGHSINVEFDGLSSRFALNKLTNIEGMYIRICAGRALSNAQARFSTTPYARNKNDIDNIDLAGFIFVPYDDKQYTLSTQFYVAHNVIDMKDRNDFTQGFESVGDLYSATASFKVDGIGDGWSDFTDYMIFFLSGAMTQTQPKKDMQMLGSVDSEVGYSLWSGLQFDSLISDDGRWGLEYNYGSKYWRSVTYGEDTLVGSKLAARGSAYEVYFTEPLIEEHFSMQLRATYIDYDYSGSNGFFGSQTGTPIAIADAKAMGMGNQVVDKASDVRLYLRYKY